LTVAAGSNLQTALNNASCGDTLLLQAGATFTGVFTLPAKGCDSGHWITIRTSAPNSSLPPEGTRITPCYAGVSALPGRPSFNCASTANVMAKIMMGATSASGPLSLANGANYYRFIGLEITRPAGTGIVYNLVSLQNGGTADHIIFDRSWLHGVAQDETTRGIALGGSTYLGVVDSFFTDFHCTSATGGCTDSQTIGGGLGSLPMGPYKIVNNFLEASGENILFGGGAATLTPADVEVRRNHFFKPLIWKQGQPGYVGGASGNAFSVKNHFELKNGRRVLFEGNILEYTWGGFSQAGYSVLLTPKNQSNVCPLCQVTDITIRYNTISHVGSVFQIANILSDSGGVMLDGERYSIHDVTADDINPTAYSGPGVFGLVMMAQGSPVLQHVTFNHITAFAPTTMFYIGNGSGGVQMADFNFTNSLVTTGIYPIWSTGGLTNCAFQDVPLPTLNACFSSYTFTANALIGSATSYPLSSWPTGNYFPSGVSAVQFTNYAANDYSLASTSPYATAGTDGKALGADTSALNTAIAGVY
jgi:hypothetical protein